MSLSRFLGVAMAAAVLALSACAGSESKRSTAETGSDAALTTKVKTAIASDAGIGSASAINVQTYRGTVQLSGFVDSPEKIQRAADAARKVEGVRTVENNIKVKPSS
jgi:hyperosmotically inducible periplasmic protein